jgi:hypothetical protein
MFLAKMGGSAAGCRMLVTSTLDQAPVATLKTWHDRGFPYQSDCRIELRSS